ncbi:MAG: hypothetical protein Q9223_007573 [Gallowayella weberi]
MSSITDQVRLNRHHLFTRPRDNTGVNNVSHVKGLLDSYVRTIEAGSRQEIVRERDRLLAVEGHQVRAQVFRKYWAYFMTFAEPLRATMIYAEAGYDWDNHAYNYENPRVTTEQWEEDVRHVLSFGQLLLSKVAPLGAQPGQQAAERLWHAPDSPARQVLLGTIAPPVPYELTAYNLGAIMADLYPATHYQEYQYGEQGSGGVSFLQETFNLGYIDPYAQPA